MRLMWVSQSPTSMTGLGKSARYILEGLSKKFEVISVGYNFEPQHVAPLDIKYEIQGLRLDGTNDPAKLGDQVKDYAIKYRPDIIVFFGDVRYFTYIPEILKSLPECLLAGYITTDCSNLPVNWLPTISCLDYLIVTSGFAAEEIDKIYNRQSQVVYLGYNPQIFNTNNKVRVQGLADKQFVAFRVDRNQSRKNWAATFDIWDKWCEDKDAILLYHTKLEAEDLGAPNLKEYLYNKPHMREKSVCSKNYLFDEAEFCGLLKSSDVFFTTTMGEGFGLSILESAACGIPTIGIDFSASGELIRNGAGIAIEAASYFANSEGVKMALPNEYKMREALDKVYSDRQCLAELSQRAVEWSKPYTWQTTVNGLIQCLSNKVNSKFLSMRVINQNGQLANLNIERLV